MASLILGNSVNVQVCYKLEKLLIPFVCEIMVNKAFSYLLLDFIPGAPCGAEERLLKIGTEFEFLPRNWLALRIVISIVGGEECPDLTLSSDFWKMNSPGMSELGWVGLNYIDSRQLFAYVDLCWGKEVAERRLPKGWMCDGDSSSGLSWEWWVRAMLKPPLPHDLDQFT